MMRATLRELQAHISQQLRNPEHQANSIRSMVQVLAVPGKIQHLLQGLLRDNEALENIAANSYTHHNGFDKITLLTSGEPEYKLRLHIWWPEAATTQEHIHNHSWNYSSALLTGGFRFQLFKTAEEGDTWYQYLCGFPDAGMGYKMTLQGQAHLQCEFDCQMQAGSAYSLFYDSLHKVSNNSHQLTSTLMLHGHFIRRTSLLFARQPIDHASHVAAIPFTVEELGSKIDRYLSLTS